MLNLFTNPEQKAKALIANAEQQAKQFYDAAEAISGQIEKENTKAKRFAKVMTKILHGMMKLTAKVDAWAVKRNYNGAIKVYRLEELRDRTVRTGKAYQRFLDGI